MHYKVLPTQVYHTTELYCTKSWHSPSGEPFDSTFPVFIGGESTGEEARGGLEHHVQRRCGVRSGCCGGCL